jgi:hypothetical protein
MKKNLILVLATIIVVLILASCKKYDSSPSTMYPGNSRKIRFQLYTNKDFSGETSVINFSLFIKNANSTLFDSALAPMQIKDIPDSAHKLVIEKTVTGNGHEDLAAGFVYEIQNVGVSWYIDTSKAGNGFKVIDYAFQ